MYYLDDLGQQEIAEILGVSRSTVSRLLARARECGIVRISVDEYDPRDREAEAQLVARLRLRQAVVVRTIGEATDTVRRTIGYFGAPAIAPLVRPNASIGVTGGRTLRELIAFLMPPGERGAIAVAQLMGNIGPTPTAIDALELSRTLAHRFGGTFYTVNAPAIVPDRATRDVFLAHEHIRTVWGMFGSLQLAFVGVGSLDESAFIERGVLDRATLAELRQAGAVGEVCGRFFDASGEECVSSVRDRVVAAGLDVLRRCPDVVAVTNGAGRAAAVSAAARGRLITSLVVDDRCARALLTAV
jgi:deoxyribonucleoside regulator